MSALTESPPRSIRRLVVKIGSGVVTFGGSSGLEIDRNVFFRIAREVAAARHHGVDVAIVSSGAVALGIEELGLDGRPESMSAVQATAAVGQGLLMSLWREAFARHRLKVGQVLLTHSDLADRQRYLNVRATLDSLLEAECVPVINENDTVATDEIAFGDNDRLATQVANLMGADALVLLSTVDGLLDPAGQLVPYVALSDDPMALVQSRTSSTGRGGMGSKVQSARAAARGGIAVTIANGKKADSVLGLVEGRPIGTRFEHAEQGLPSRKHWIAYTLKPRGALTVDPGAARALRHEGASLLSVGITVVDGDFGVGDLVRVLDPSGNEIARGLIRLAAPELRGQVGTRGPVAIHRDDLVTI